MNIFDKLKFTGIEIGNVQSVNEMTVVPIIGGDRGNVAPPSALKFKKTVGYGVMSFENQDRDREAIVPACYMVRGPGAQDHCMSGSGIAKKYGTTEFRTACCIEQRQGGYLSDSNNEEDVLPVELRKALLKPTLRNETSFSKLWGKISDWLKGLRLQGSGAAHLRYFYDTPDIKTALEDFAAEFEPVDNQIGAIIMFAGVPVGIEIMPTAEHWGAYWKQLIRGCYGAELLRLKMLGKVKPSALILPEIPAEASPSEVKNILENFSLHLRQEIIPLLENININSQQVSSKTRSGIETNVVITNGGGGDLIVQNNEPIYLSIVL